MRTVNIRKLKVTNNTYLKHLDGISPKALLIPRYNLAVPIVLNQAGRLVDGYHRVQKAKHLRIDFLPCRVVL